MKNFKKDLDTLRSELNRTDVAFTEIARRAEVSAKTVSRIASGFSMNPRILTALRIAEALVAEERAARPAKKSRV